MFLKKINSLAQSVLMGRNKYFPDIISISENKLAPSIANFKKCIVTNESKSKTASKKILRKSTFGENYWNFLIFLGFAFVFEGNTGLNAVSPHVNLPNLLPQKMQIILIKLLKLIKFPRFNENIKWRS